MTTSPTPAYSRLNIYLDDEELRTQVKIAAARRGVSVSSFCVGAIRARLEAERPSATESRRAAAQALDRFRRRIGPIGIPVAELIREGRKR